MSELWSALSIGFLLGIKHSLEPDHIVAVSTLARKHKSIKRSSLEGVTWGIGHTLTIALVGVIVFLMKVSIPNSLATVFEGLVGIMIIYLGVKSVIDTIKQKQMNHKLYRPAVIGFVHGLAGSAAMIVLLMTTVDSMTHAFLYLALFGGGTILGMMSFTILLGLPFSLFSVSSKWKNTLSLSMGMISVIFGVFYITSIYL
ncbi:HoxN/HupN/NixA family nickel/cobalt transporter [Halobacillus mangrovi]|uniref:HoxN/HupN/NixA family nickel/cobalt transporter n=1 Tax=Halobacillus mangrovi TaxID=402384 RepID=UPI001E46ACD2|nr:urease accessory protein UreH [Halobacillus mangrovi]